MHQAKLLVRARGVDAVTDPEVAQVLQLTGEQRERIRDARLQNAANMKQCVRKCQQSERGRGIRGLLRAIQKETHAQILAVLSDKQRLLFDQLKCSPPVDLGVDPEPPQAPSQMALS